MGEADVALLAVGVAYFAEISEELGTAACAVIGGVVYHGVDALGVDGFALFVDSGWDDKAFDGFSGLYVADEWNVSLGYEVEDVASGKALEYEIELWLFDGSFLCDEVFVDELIVDEQASVASQQCGNSSFFEG